MTTKPAPEREAGGYEYRDEFFGLVDVTSVPKTDAEALEYFKTIHAWGQPAVFILKREMNDYKYQPMPYKYDPQTKEVTRIE